MRYRRAVVIRKQMVWSARVVVVLAVTLASLPTVAAISWPGETWSASTDLTSLNPSGWSKNLSGAYWNPVTRRLWVCTNGPGAFWSLKEDGLGSFMIDRSYTGTGDLEAITQTPTDENLVFLMDERARILRFLQYARLIETWRCK